MVDTTPTDSLRATQLYERAQQYLVGGVSASARLHPSLGRPFFASHGEGGRVWDQDGRVYIDFNMSHGASLLGHGNPVIRRAVERALDMGVLCSFETEYQTEVAKKITELVPCADLVRFSGSGTETTWLAVRTARAFTGREKVVKFEGHFHGYNDVLGYSMWPPLAEAGPEEAPVAVPQSAGMAESGAESVIVLPWNNLPLLEHVLRAESDSIAAVIMEPINYNCGTIMPDLPYLRGVRELTRELGIVLIFDEILSGFRTGPGCAQAYLGVTPDLCTLGKALGGGTPLSAFAGRRDIMEAVAPIGRAVHSGTYNAHLIPILAAGAFLTEIDSPEFWQRLQKLERFFYPSLREVFQTSGLPVMVQAVGARFSLLFGLDTEPRSYRDTVRADRQLESQFYRAAIEHGVYFHSAPHHGFSAMHTQADLEEALDRISAAARSLAGKRLTPAREAARRSV